LLFVALALEFGEGEFVMGQQHGMICRDFNANTVPMGIGRCRSEAA